MTSKDKGVYRLPKNITTTFKIKLEGMFIHVSLFYSDDTAHVRNTLDRKSLLLLKVKRVDFRTCLLFKKSFPHNIMVLV